MPAHQRLSVHNVTFYGTALAELESHWTTLAVSRLSILDSQLLDPEFPKLLQRTNYTVEAAYHLFAGGRLTTDAHAAQDALMPVIDAAAWMVYLLTGGRDSLTWNRAADRFATMIAPCVAHAQQVWIDGQSIYRLSGNRGTAPFFNVTVQRARVPGPGVLHEPFGDTPEANLFGRQLSVGDDGEFQIYIGGPERGPNWLPTTEQSRKLFIRQGFDRWDERPARLRIERVDMTTPKLLPSPEIMVEAMQWAGDFVTGLISDWPEFPFTYGGVDAEHPNEFPTIPGVGTGDADSKRGRAAANMYWELASDEALIVEFDAHDGLWMFTNMGVFFNSMDYLYRPVSYTPSHTKTDSDGRIRLVMAHRDPNVHNWLDTQGFERGNLTYRHMLDGEPAVLDAHVVKQ